jgi:DNA-directed RNA polymerase subunit RPC12/RpoP
MGRQKCISCGRLSPETNGEHTLTTSYGWRIRKAVDDAGTATVEWRCPACWHRFKSAQKATESSHPSVMPPAGPRDPRGEGNGSH